jgi:hypothetical protein
VANPNSATNILTVQGKVDTQKGIMKTTGTGIEIVTRSGNGTYNATVDLPKWNLDSNAVFKLVMPDQKTRPSLGISIYGPLNQLTKEFDTKEVEQYVADRLSKGLIKNNVISDKYQDVLKPGGLQNTINQKLMDKLGIKQPQTAPAPTAPAAPNAAPANDNNAVTVEPLAPAQPQPAQPQLTPEQQLLEQGLKGLFGK